MRDTIRRQAAAHLRAVRMVECMGQRASVAGRYERAARQAFAAGHVATAALLHGPALDRFLRTLASNA